MYRFLVLYSKYSDPGFHYAEGLIQFDKSVYVRCFSPSNGPFFGDMHHLECSLRDNDDLGFWRIQMIDKKQGASQQ